MEETTVFTIYGKCRKNLKIHNLISNLTSLASFGDVLALMTRQEDVAKSIAAKLKG